MNYRYFTNVSWSPDEQHIYVIELNRDQNHAQLVCYKEEDFSVLPACFTIQLSPMLCRVVISYNMLNVSLILLIFLRSIF